MTVIPHWLEKRAFLTPNRTAIQLIDKTKITFEQLRNDAITFAGQLTNVGIKKGDHVSLLSNNSYEMVVAIHALSYLKVRVVLLNTRLSKHELYFQFTDSECLFLLYEDGLEEKITEIAEANRDHIYSLSGIQSQSMTSIEVPQEMNLEEDFTIIYTSGTTGFPKGVQQTYGNHFWSAMGSALNLGLQDNDRWLAALPLFHVSGLSVLIRSVLYGMPVHLHRGFKKEDVHREIMEEGVTIVSVVTVMLEELIRYLDTDRYPKTFRCALLGGGPAPVPLLERCKQKEIPVFQSYGMTETSSQIVTLSSADAMLKIGSAGKPLFPAQLKIIKDNQPANSNEVGEILVKGPMVTRGYFKRAEDNLASFDKGWLFTGDLGYVDEDGYLYVLDRRKDLIISGGENIYPAEIEGVLKSYESVLDAGVIGIEDERWGQVPAAFLVLEEGAILTKSSILSYLEERLAKYKLPKYFFLTNQLPRNASKKLLRRILAEWQRNGENYDELK